MGHDHSHEHGHPHEHEPPHEDEPESARDRVPASASASAPSLDPLAPAEGAGRVLFFDCFSGISGDMTVGALLGLGVPLTVVEHALAALPLDGFHLETKHIQRSGISATSFDVHVTTPQPERTFGAIDRMLENSSLDAPSKGLSRAIFRRLAEAEAAVHRRPVEEVHFHEVGAVDSIVDIVGAAAALSYVGAEVVVSALPMGHGFVSARHGMLPLPAPAVVECLRKAPTYAVDTEGELVTPTGAAIVATVASGFERWPASFAPDRIGYGAGKHSFSRAGQPLPNLLRVVLGRRSEMSDAATLSMPSTHVVIETNVDDLTGELAAHALEALLSAGALDAWATPIVMKKGRPALTLSAIAAMSHADAVAKAMLEETTTIGVRRVPVSRVERPRNSITVMTAYGPISVKISGGPYGAPQVKAEMDDCVAAARVHKVAVREVIAAALAAARGVR
jgi:uncharacterized protein (TIGR00299 family) protein